MKCDCNDHLFFQGAFSIFFSFLYSVRSFSKMQQSGGFRSVQQFSSFFLMTKPLFLQNSMALWLLQRTCRYIFEMSSFVQSSIAFSSSCDPIQQRLYGFSTLIVMMYTTLLTLFPSAPISPLAAEAIVISSTPPLSSTYAFSVSKRQEMAPTRTSLQYPSVEYRLMAVRRSQKSWEQMTGNVRQFRRRNCSQFYSVNLANWMSSLVSFLLGFSVLAL